MINVRKIDSVEITDKIKKMFLESAYNIGDDVTGVFVKQSIEKNLSLLRKY